MGRLYEAVASTPVSPEKSAIATEVVCPVAVPASKSEETPEEGRNYTLQLLLLLLLQSVARAISFRSQRYGKRGSKRRPGKNTKSGGSDPRFWAKVPPKSRQGSLPPKLRL